MGKLPVVGHPLPTRVLIPQLRAHQLKLRPLVQTLPLVSESEAVVLVIYRHPEGGPVQDGLATLLGDPGAVALQTASLMSLVQQERAGFAAVTVASLHIVPALARS